MKISCRDHNTRIVWPNVYSRVLDEAQILRAVGSRAINQFIWERALSTTAVKEAIRIQEIWVDSRTIKKFTRKQHAIRKHFRELKLGQSETEQEGTIAWPWRFQALPFSPFWVSCPLELMAKSRTVQRMQVPTRPVLGILTSLMITILAKISKVNGIWATKSLCPG